MLSPRIITGIVVVASLFCSNFAAAQTFFWNGGGGSDNWGVPTNWSGGVAPTPGPDVDLAFGAGAANFNMVNDYTNPCFNRLAFSEAGYSLSGNSIELVASTSNMLPQVVGFDNTNVTTDWILLDELTYSGSALTNGFVYGGTISGSAALNLHGGFTLASSGAINNTGAININSNSGTVTVNGIIGAGGDITLANSFVMAGTGVINRNILMPGAADFSSSGTLTVNGDVSITNAPNNLLTGTLAVNGVVEVSGGSLQASGGTVLAGIGNLRLAGGGSAFLDGTVAATRNVELTGILFPVFITGNGMIEGNVNVDGNHIVQGNLTINQNLTYSNTTSVATLGSSGDTLTVNGLTTVDHNSVVRLEGTLAGLGSTLLESGSTLQMAGILDQDLIVRGTLNGIGGSPFTHSVTAENAILIGLLDVQNTLNVQTAGVTQLLAAANLSVSGLTTLNTSIFRIDDSAVFNAIGNVGVSGGGTLNVNGDLIGNLQMDSTTFLTGSGLVAGAIVLDGTLGPGNSAGTLGIDGSIDLTSTSTVCIEIGGSSMFDVVDGRSTSTLSLGNSTLELLLIDGFVPNSGDEFLFMQNFASITGQFGNVGGGGGDNFLNDPRVYFNGGSFGVEYRGDSIRLYDFIASVPEPGCVWLLVGLACLCVNRRVRHV